MSDRTSAASMPRSRVSRRVLGRRWAAAAIGLVLGAATGAQQNVAGADGVVDYGTLVANKRYPTELTIVNVDCAGSHDFEIDLHGYAGVYLRLSGDPAVRGVATGETRRLPAVLDLRGAKPGVYDGQVVVRCTSCPADCELDRRVYAFRLGIEETASGGSRPPGEGAPPPHGQSDAPPERQRKPTRYCGPDVSQAFERALMRLRRRLFDVEPRLTQGEGREAAVREFLGANARRLVGYSDTRCRHDLTFDECWRTVSLLGACVDIGLLKAILDGFADVKLGHPDDGAGWQESRRYADPFAQKPPPEADYAAAFGLGRALGDWDAQRDSGDLGAEWRRRFVELQSHPPPIGLRSLHLQCTLCAFPSSFREDWTTETWKLPDGSELADR